MIETYLKTSQILYPLETLRRPSKLQTNYIKIDLDILRSYNNLVKKLIIIFLILLISVSFFYILQSKRNRTVIHNANNINVEINKASFGKNEDILIKIMPKEAYMIEFTFKGAGILTSKDLEPSETVYSLYKINTYAHGPGEAILEIRTLEGEEKNKHVDFTKEPLFQLPIKLSH